MAMTRNEIQKKSDEKRGIVQKNLKLHQDTVALLAELAAKTGKPQNQIIAEALQRYAEQV